MTNIFPTDYTTKTTPDGTDVVWSSDGITNFNLTITSILLYIIANISTDNIDEGVTNLYYTEDRVANNTTVINKADKSNVLELDNTTSYTPTEDFHPATKDYVDNKAIPEASETVKGIVERATDEEVQTGTDTTRYASPKQIKDKTQDIIGTFTDFSNSTTITATQNGFVYIALKMTGNNGRIDELLINGTLVGGVESTSNNGRMYSSLTYPVKKGDTYRVNPGFGSNILSIRRFIPMG